MQYKDRIITHEQADNILKSWGHNKVSYAENHHGNVYWNKETGEILWYANEESECNASLIS